MCEVGAKTANVARHALVNALQICETDKNKENKKRKKPKSVRGVTVGGVWATLVYSIVSEPFGLLSLCCPLELICKYVAAYATCIHTLLVLG